MRVIALEVVQRQCGQVEWAIPFAFILTTTLQRPPGTHSLLVRLRLSDVELHLSLFQLHHYVPGFYIGGLYGPQHPQASPCLRPCCALRLILALALSDPCLTCDAGQAHLFCSHFWALVPLHCSFAYAQLPIELSVPFIACLDVKQLGFC